MPEPDAVLKDFVELLSNTFKLEVLFAVPVYGLTLVQLQRKENPEQVGWRAVAVDEGRSLVASEIPKDWAADQPLVRFTRGTIVGQSLEAFRQLSQDPEMHGLFPRQLRVSALRLDTFWIKKSADVDKIAEKDVILPFTRFPLEHTFKPLDGGTFLRHVEDAAGRRREGNDRSKQA